MNTELINLVVDMHSENFGEKLNPNDLSFVMQNSRCGQILFVFLKKERLPRYVYKTSPQVSFQKLLENEYFVLEKIKALTEAGYRKSLPQILWSGRVSGQHFLLELFCCGINFNNHICSVRNSEKEVEDIFSLVTDWLIGLNSTRVVKQCLRVDDIYKSIESYQQAQELTSLEKDIINGFCEKEKQNIEQIPCIIEHRDFSSWNIIYQKQNKNISVLDWGYSTISGFPTVDLFNFLVTFQAVISGYNRARDLKILFSHLIQNIKRPRTNFDDFKNIFYGDTWISHLAKKYINRYCEVFNINQAQQRILFLIFIVRNLYHDKGFLEFYLDNENL